MSSPLLTWETLMPVLTINAADPAASTTLPMNEITGGRRTVATNCRITRRAGNLVVTVEASDPDPLGLIATAPVAGREDHALYEEDCLHIATSLPGAPQPHGFTLVNPHGSHKGNEVAKAWRIDTQRHEQGWKIDIAIPLPEGIEAIGLIVLRFYRGVHHEVHGLTNALPHPMDVRDFAAVLLKETDNPRDAGERFIASVRAARQRELDDILTQTRTRIAAALAKPGRPTVSMETAYRLAEARLQKPPVNSVSYLCWNEQHFQNALLDLWDIDQDRRWLETLIERCEVVWSFRGHHANRKDGMFGEVLPTWYDATDSGSMPITLGTGVILMAIGRLMHTIHRDPKLRDLWKRVEHWVEYFRETIAVHDREWLDLPGGSGNYLEPFEKGPARVYPRGGSRICPLNRSFALAIPMLHMARITGDAVYLDRVTRMARYFKNSCETLDNGSLVWEYLTSRYGADGEDLSHASCEVLFAELCAAAGVVFTQEDIRGIARTLELNIFRYGDVPCEGIRGHDPGFRWYVGPWASPTRYAPHLLPRMFSLVEAAMSEATFDFVQQGWGVRNVTTLLLAQHVIRRQATQS